MDTAIQKAQHTIDFVRSSDEDFRAYQMRELAMCDYTSRMNQSLKKGHAAGLEEGIAKGMVEGMAKGIVKGRKEGHRKGLKEGIEKGAEKSLAKGREESFSQIILSLYAKGMSRKDISDLINMPVKQVSKYIR
jgi:flagellar biosynthesis/type III secretory pathway protein FliH